MVDVYQPDPIVSSVINYNIDCYSENIGSSSVNVTGGVGSYNYLLIDENNMILSSGNDSVSGLFSGSYSWIISDNNSCYDTLGIFISENEELNFTVDTIKNVSCYLGNDGLISISNLNSSVYSVFWSTGDTINTIKDLSAGVYYCTVMDEFDCFKVDSFTISQPELLSIYSEVYNASCKEVFDASIFASIQGGTSPYDIKLTSDLYVDSVSSVFNNEFNSLSHGEYD